MFRRVLFIIVVLPGCISPPLWQYFQPNPNSMVSRNGNDEGSFYSYLAGLADAGGNLARVSMAMPVAFSLCSDCFRPVRSFFPR